MLSRFLISSLALATCATLARPVCAADLIHLSAAQRNAAGIRTHAVSDGAADATASITLQGHAVLPPQAVETVSAPVSGFVQSVLVTPTDRLRAGQLVARMHSTELIQWQREFVQLESLAQQAQDRLQRSERLLADGIVAESRVREDRHANTQAQVATKERRLSLQMAGLDDARLRKLVETSVVQAQLGITTSRDGVVMEIMATPGQRVEAGAPLLKLARSGLLALELQATQAQSTTIQPGATVQVVGCAQTGRVRGLDPMVRGSNQAVTVHVDLAGAAGKLTCLRPNQALAAEVATRSEAAVTSSVPSSALFQHQGNDHLFMQVGDAFRAEPVQVLQRSATHSRLSVKLPAGTRVVTQGISTLKAAWLGMGEDARGKP